MILSPIKRAELAILRRLRDRLITNGAGMGLCCEIRIEASSYGGLFANTVVSKFREEMSEAIPGSLAIDNHLYRTGLVPVEQIPQCADAWRLGYLTAKIDQLEGRR